jgi:hypothetical protein
MKAELEQKLIEKYPTLFKGRNLSPKESLMCFGCEFGDGWYKIFDELCCYLTCLSEQDELLRVGDEFKTEENHGYEYVNRPTISFTQVKEKYGTMRVYWSGNGITENDEKIFDRLTEEGQKKAFKRYYDQIENAIEYVEFLSGRTCEICGEPGKLYNNGWVMCRCKKCIVDHYGFDPDENLKENE